MAAGTTSTGSLADSQESIRHAARIVREYEGRFMATCETHTLPKNTGLTWNEIALEQLSAQNITENTELDNPQQIIDTLFQVTPTVSGIQTLITKRVQERLAKVTIAKLGPLGQNAIQRKKDEDYIATFATATTTLSGAGTTLQHGVISSAKSRITSNATEPAKGEIHGVFHGFQIKDLQDELESGVGTYTVGEGPTARTYSEGFHGRISNVHIWEDGNIAIDGSDDARGAVHAKEGVVMIQGFEPRTFTRERPEIGGGADEMFMYDEYGFGLRASGIWLIGVLSDATTPSN